LLGEIPDLGVFRLVGEQKPDRDGDGSAHQTADDVQPSPS
jgi:hypothetical protein